MERERQLLDEKRVKWVTRRTEMITRERNERFQGGMGVGYRVNKQAVEKKPALATESEGTMEEQLVQEQYLMEPLLVCEVEEWENLFWNKLRKFFWPRSAMIEWKRKKD